MNFEDIYLQNPWWNEKKDINKDYNISKLSKSKRFLWGSFCNLLITESKATLLSKPNSSLNFLIELHRIF